jgi:DNA (cytosine-5)-methyltransferase 1
MTALTVGSLFSGIGGLDLGLERAGMRVIWQSEIDDYACRVLKKHWPEVPNHGDIKRINWGKVERPDVICGGYPCQPFSQAGNRKGNDDPRHLWPWVYNAISELRPRYAIMENVRGHLSLGGMSVIGDFASIGYSAEWRIISAASVGANHKRDRIFIVAYPADLFGDGGNNYPRVGMEPEKVSKFGDHGRPLNMADARSVGRMDSKPEIFTTERGFASFGEFTGGSWWATEPDLGRMANGIPSRVDRLKGLGNAVVPQVAEIVGRLVVEHSTR